MLFINKDLVKMTGYEHDVTVEIVTLFMAVYERLTPEYKQIMLLTLSHEIKKLTE